MSVGDLVCAVLLGGLGAFRLAQARQAWRGPSRGARRLPPDALMQPFGDHAARGAVRAVAAQVVILFAAAWLLAAAAVASAVPGPAGSAIRAVGGIVGVAGVLFGAVAGLLIILFNRPRFLVPPSARQDRGVLTGR